MRQLPVVNRVPCVDPFSEQDEAAFQSLLQYMPLHRRPLLQQVVLRVHPFGDEVAPALQGHLTGVREVDANVRAVNLLLSDQRLVSDERLRLCFAEVLVVVRPLGPKQMGRAGVLGKITV